MSRCSPNEKPLSDVKMMYVLPARPAAQLVDDRDHQVVDRPEGLAIHSELLLLGARADIGCGLQPVGLFHGVVTVEVGTELKGAIDAGSFVTGRRQGHGACSTPSGERSAPPRERAGRTCRWCE